MALSDTQQIINNGAFIDDPSAETVYVSFQKTKTNFDTIWRLLEQQGYQKEFLNLSGIDTSRSEMIYIADAIERGKFVGGSYGTPWEAPIGKKLLFMTITQSGQDNFGTGTPNTNIKWEYRFYRIHRKGQIFGGNGGVIITSSDVSPAGSFTIGRAEQPDAFIDLGNIGGADVWFKFNEGKPAPDLGDPWYVSGLTMVTAIQNGVNRTWRFSGNQRMDIDEGYWGGSNTSDPNYLAAIDEDFDLLSNQPTVFPDLFITKTSKKYRNYALNEVGNNTLQLSPEYTTFNLSVESGSGNVAGFSEEPAIYDGADIYVKNEADPIATLLHNVGDVPFWFKNETDLTLNKGDIFHFKYNLALNRLEYVGEMKAENTPVPFGNLKVLKREGNANGNAIEGGDLVVTSWLNDNIYLVMGEYVSGDTMELASYDPSTTDYADLS